MTRRSHAAAELNEPDAALTEAPADGDAQHPGGRIVVVDGPPAPGAKPADGPYPDGLARLLNLVAAHMPKAEVDAVWAFPGVRREGREYGVAVVSRVVSGEAPADGPTDALDDREPAERRRVYRARYTLELKGEKRGRATLELEEAAVTPPELVHRVIEGVARRADEAGEAELVDLGAWKADDGVAG